MDILPERIFTKLQVWASGRGEGMIFFMGGRGGGGVENIKFFIM